MVQSLADIPGSLFFQNPNRVEELAMNSTLTYSPINQLESHQPRRDPW